MAKKQQLDIIGITDHNTLGHCSFLKKLGEKNGVFVLQGAEITTREEVHCLVFFKTDQALAEFQHYLDEHLPFVRNNPDVFGHQLIVDDDENILKEVEPLLIVGLDQSITEVRHFVKELGGLFVPAHVDRSGFGLLSQLGFLPDNLLPDAVEISVQSTGTDFRNHYPDFEPYPLLRNSDAHHPDQIGQSYTDFLLDYPSFDELCLALKGQKGREVLPV